MGVYRTGQTRKAANRKQHAAVLLDDPDGLMQLPKGHLQGLLGNRLAQLKRRFTLLAADGVSSEVGWSALLLTTFFDSKVLSTRQWTPKSLEAWLQQTAWALFVLEDSLLWYPQLFLCAGLSHVCGPDQPIQDFKLLGAQSTGPQARMIQAILFRLGSPAQSQNQRVPHRVICQCANIGISCQATTSLVCWQSAKRENASIMIIGDMTCCGAHS